MSDCELVPEEDATAPGTTLFTSVKSSCIKETGVYLPPGLKPEVKSVNVILWTHGYYVSNARNLFNPKKSDMLLRQKIAETEKKVVLVAPWLGYQDGPGQGTLKVGELGSKDGCGRFLKQIMGALARYQNSLLAQPVAGTVPPLEIDNLIVAGHSAGGHLMRAVIPALGDFKPVLKECWGFDCFYDTEWANWARNLSKPEKFLYFGNGSNSHAAIQTWKDSFGTPKRPNPPIKLSQNLHMVPALTVDGTPVELTAFRSFEDIQNKPPMNAYDKVRKELDPLLDDSKAGRYWDAIFPRLTEHFAVVRSLFGPRVAQSSVL